ncbi:MAG: aminodeoxychorismate synthase component I [Desulfobacteraceae bacterium]|nr:aminodeoxychorismate synthase component I [Desulfobacteraceae bacterium]
MSGKTKNKIDKLLPDLSRIHIETAPDLPDMLSVSARFSHLPGTVSLMSGGDLDCARYHILGVLPWLTLKGTRQGLQLKIDDITHDLSVNPLDGLRMVLQRLHLKEQDPEIPLAAGFMGYLAYDLKDCLEDLPRTSVDDLQLPVMLLYAPSVIIIHDKHQGTNRIIAPVRSDRPGWVEKSLSRFRELLSRKGPQSSLYVRSSDRLKSDFTQIAYENSIRRIIDYIGAGDVYQVNFSQRYRTDFQGDGFEFFKYLYKCNPAPFFAFVQAKDHQIISTSPERFLLRRGSQIETRPIKGTRPRSKEPEKDAAMRAELTTSAKDDAELSMIVDLLRNDIGKVCKAGSVEVAEHKRLEAYENVYHLVSIIKGELDNDKDCVDLLKAAFPGGSITGCPKIRAMEIIDELEPCRRHVYCGSIGYISFHETLDLSIAIRTATIAGNTLRYSVGGAIVYDSDPTLEYEETLHKGSTLMNAFTACGKDAGPAETVWLNGRLVQAAKAAVPVTDQGLLYGNGFFETIRADNGKAPLFEDHMARFHSTWRALMPNEPPELTWDHIIAQVLEANGLETGCASVKVLATRGSSTSAPWDNNLLVSARAYSHRLNTLKETKNKGLSLGIYPHPRQSPLAAHKTLNYLYYLHASQWAKNAGFDEALILNPDGTVSETNTANILLINGRDVILPDSPAALTGVMCTVVRRQLLRWGFHISQRTVKPEELRSAQLVLLTNALMGAAPVLSVDHCSILPESDLYQKLNNAIIPGWDKTGKINL